MSDTRLEEYIARALEAKARGDTVDVAELCKEAPELQSAVEEALSLDDGLREEFGRDPWIGKQLAERYELEEWLGAGAMGVVYVARDMSLQRNVAIKVLQQGVFATPARRERFAREARVLASLKHRNVVQIHDQGISADGLHFIVMDLVSGQPMSKLLRRHEEAGARPRDWIVHAVTWCAQIASALASAHAAGVLHRDVKPSNILIDEDGEAILADFGIAQRVDELALTVGGTTLGTPSYMAPEQANDASRLDARADVYGLCATLYHLVTNRPPYEGEYRSVLELLRRRDPKPARAINPKLPIDLCAILEHGMCREPEGRYGEMEALEADLRAFLEHRPVQARPVGRVRRRLRAIRRRPLPWLVAAGLLVSVPAAAGVYARHRDDVRLAAERDTRRYRDLRASLPPSLAIEGSLETRLKIPVSESEDMLDKLEEIARLRPDDLYASLLRCGLLVDLGRHAEAGRVFERFVLAGVPGDRYLRAMRRAYDKAADAEQKGTEAIAIAGDVSPDSARACCVAMFRALRRKDYAGARLLVERSEGEAATDAFALHCELVEAFKAQGILERRELFRAVSARADAVERRLGFPTAKTLYFRGTVANAQDDLPTARELLDASAKASERRSYGPLFNLAIVSKRLFSLDLAESLCREAMELRPLNENARSLLVEIYCGRRDFAKARELLRSMPEEAYLLHGGLRERLRVYVSFREMMTGVSSGVLSAEVRRVARRCSEECGRAIPLLRASDPDRAHVENMQKIARVFAADRSGFALPIAAVLAKRAAAKDAGDSDLLRFTAIMLERASAEQSDAQTKQAILAVAQLLAQLAQHESARAAGAAGPTQNTPPISSSPQSKAGSKSIDPKERRR